MDRRRAIPWAVLSVFALIALVAAGMWLGSRNTPRTSPSASPRRSATASTRPTHRLAMRLSRVTARPVRGRVHTGRLRRPARAIERVMTELYSAGFVDPARWRGGSFPSIFPLFASAERARVRRDLDELTLGRAARRLDAVRPRRARLSIRFLTDAAGRPVVAVAAVRFNGTGVAASADIPIRQVGEFTLRHVNGPWRIVGYRVRNHAPSALEIRQRAAEASAAPPPPFRRPIFFLVIGSDARPGQNVDRARADSIHIVGVNPRTGTASIVGIPRDSYVPIPGHGRDKINASLSLGGPRLTVETVERLSGIHLSGYVLTGFRGFEQLVRAVGPVRVRIPYPMADRMSHAFFREGPTELGARKALAFNRDRHDVPGGDIGRSLNQGRFLIDALAELRAELEADPFGFASWAIAAVRYAQTDLSFSEVVDLALAAPAVRPARVRNRVVSGHGATVGNSSVVILDQQAYATFRDLRADATLGR